jgi:beta-1,4-mannosyl-glycoprotein beta-1,4-N-acetylglucosaminyltransferase
MTRELGLKFREINPGCVVDAFSLNNEIEMLNIRMHILDPYVDIFLIAEATETFSGKPKPLNFDVNRGLFEKFRHKIKYLKILDTPKGRDDANCDQRILNLAKSSPQVTTENDCWLKEFYQKEKIADALEEFDREDICFISDIDEIWNFGLDLVIKDFIYKYRIDMCFIEYVNVRSTATWRSFTGPIASRRKLLDGRVLNHVRNPFLASDAYRYVSNGGWHFDSLGGVDKKISEFEHPVYTKKYMEKRKKGAKVSEIGLPDYLTSNRQLFPHLFRA